tara:strand:- start:4728 stop:5189 length:462 start_codon:yes stop_codon:yes gene_type:complete
MAGKYWIAGKPDKVVNCKDVSGSAAGVNVGSIIKLSKTFSYTEMTDGGGTVGSLLWEESIPVGATVLHCAVVNLVKFGGDSSATIRVGDGTDHDRYMTGTPDVFLNADALSLGNVSGVAYHATAKQPNILVTSGSDWGAVDSGSATIELYYMV